MVFFFRGCEIPFSTRYISSEDNPPWNIATWISETEELRSLKKCSHKSIRNFPPESAGKTQSVSFMFLPCSSLFY